MKDPLIAVAVVPEKMIMCVDKYRFTREHAIEQARQVIECSLRRDNGKNLFNRLKLSGIVVGNFAKIVREREEPRVLASNRAA